MAGERLALHGLPFNYAGTPYSGYEFYCGPDAGAVLGAVVGDVAPGSTATFEEVAPGRVPLAAIIEADGDNDGYGDETQDQCPQSATTQSPCPVITLQTLVKTKKKLVNVIVTPSSQANVTVNGKVNLGKGQKAKLKGGTIAAAPGVFTRFRLDFPAKLTKRLQGLPPSKKLTLKLTVSAPNVATTPTKKVLKVKLKGQAPKD